MSESQSGPPVVLTLEQIELWRGDVRRFDDEISRLQAERDSRLKLIEAGEVLLAALPVLSVSQSRPSAVVQQEEAAPPEKQVRRKRRYGWLTWHDVIVAAVARADMGLTYAELRGEVSKSELGHKLDESDKGYHNALSRAAAGGEIVKDHGRVFTPEAFKRFMEAVEAGDASTTVPQPIIHSPMGEAILSIVAKCPGELNGKGVIRELRKDPEFNAALTPHETGAYNIIARLVRRGQIVRRDDGLLTPGKNFPPEMRPAQNKIEAPSGNAAGASKEREAATSLFENVVGFPRSR